LLSHPLKKNRDEVFLCTKFGHTFIVPKPGDDASFTSQVTGIRGDPAYIRSALDASLKRLGVDRIDLYYQHRVDPNTPIEETIGALAQLVKEGKVRFLGMSECSAATLRRAYKVHPIAAVQMEYSPWTTDIETNGMLDTCRELGVTVVAFSPLGRGIMAGKIRSIDDLPANDFRRTQPRWSPENFAHNIRLVDAFDAMAKQKGCTSGQLTLAWLLAQEKNLILIPGTRRAARFDENFGALQVHITDDENKHIRELVNAASIHGQRYPADLMNRVGL
ncbi:hypothetical protein FBU59_000435, partial [Linderina macrospora]